MAERIKRTKKQIANELKVKLAKVKKDMRDEVKKAENHRAIIIGKSLQSWAETNGDAKRVLDGIFDRLTRDQDRRAFGLDLLPKPDAAPAAKPVADVAANPLAAALAARAEAVKVYNATDKSPPHAAELGKAIAAWESLAGHVWEKLGGVVERRTYGLGDRPGELLNNG
jgi:hypothetical protein